MIEQSKVSKFAAFLVGLLVVTTGRWANKIDRNH
jgi:hypothetical protein